MFKSLCQNDRHDIKAGADFTVQCCWGKYFLYHIFSDFSISERGHSSIIFHLIPVNKLWFFYLAFYSFYIDIFVICAIKHLFKRSVYIFSFGPFPPFYSIISDSQRLPGYAPKAFITRFYRNGLLLPPSQG